MAEEPNEAPAAEGEGKTFTQEDVNRIVAERVKRAAPADYDDLKAKAQKFDEFEQAQKSQEERLREQLDSLAKSNGEYERKLVRLSVLAASGIPAEHQDLVHGETAEELEASAEKVKSLLAASAPAQNESASRFVIPDEGGSPNLALNGDGIEAALKSALGIN